MLRTVTAITCVACFIVTSAFGQRQIIGKLIDSETKTPIKDALVKVDGTTLETRSNFLGFFQLTADTLDHLVIDSEGYELATVLVPSVNNFQIALSKSSGEEPIFLVVEQTATPPGGMPEFYNHIAKNLRYPAQARKMGIEGKVFVEFVIERDGSITDVRPIKGIGAGCDEEAVRAIASAPKWNPGMQKGKAIRQRMVLPIAFSLGGGATYNKPKDIYSFLAQFVQYPFEARNAGVEGVVILDFTVDPAGKILDLNLIKDIGKGCGEEAKMALMNVPPELMVSLAEKSKSHEFTIPIAFGLGRPFKTPDIGSKPGRFILKDVKVTAVNKPRQVATSTKIGSAPGFDNLYSALEKPDNVKNLSLVYRSYTSFPMDVLKLKNLEFLDLEGNQIDNLPVEIDQLSKLEELYLAENKLQMLPNTFGNMAKVKVLGLGANKLTSFPEEITLLESLEALDLGDNQLTTIPPSIGSLKNLRFLVLQNNKIRNLPPEFYQLKKLEKIYLNGNPLEQKEIEAMKQNFKKAEIVLE